MSLQGWSNEETLRALEKERDRYKETIRRGYDKFNSFSVKGLVEDGKNRDVDINIVNKEQPATNKAKLSPPRNKPPAGGDLVSLLAKQRGIPIKIPLTTTDVTRGSHDK